MIDAGTILQMVRIEHHITRHELAKQFGTTYETIKEIEDNNGDVPDEWLIYLYNNYDLSPEELYLLEYISDMPGVDKTVVTHTYKGYTAIARGRHSFSIRNADDIEVMHTSSRAKKIGTAAVSASAMTVNAASFNAEEQVQETQEYLDAAKSLLGKISDKDLEKIKQVGISTLLAGIAEFVSVGKTLDPALQWQTARISLKVN